MAAAATQAADKFLRAHGVSHHVGVVGDVVVVADVVVGPGAGVGNCADAHAYTLARI